MSLSPDSSFRYSGVCRECEHEIVQPLPAEECSNDNNGKHIRCIECGTTNYLNRGETV